MSESDSEVRDTFLEDLHKFFFLSLDSTTADLEENIASLVNIILQHQLVNKSLLDKEMVRHVGPQYPQFISNVFTYLKRKTFFRSILRILK